MLKFQPSAKFNTSAALILVTQDQLKKSSFLFKNTQVKNSLIKAKDAKIFDASAGNIHADLIGKTLLVFIGIGAEKDISETQLRVFVRKGLQHPGLKKAKAHEIVPHVVSDGSIRSVIEGVVLGTYTWEKYKTQKINAGKTYIVCAPLKPAYKRMLSIAMGVNHARDLVNENADTTNSIYLEKDIRAIIKGCKEAKIEVLNKKELKAKGLGLHLAVNQGSVNEPKLVIVKYTGNPKSKKYTALIGKGLTYDTGGLNLKPTGGIENMKLDMGGAAAVIGVLRNTVSLKLKKNVIFTVGIAENVTGSKSYKPGAVLTGYAKKSVEVANTDAEGRLVLADAIAYVNKNYKPTRIIDIATLTGACIIALGHDFTGLVSTVDELAKDLIDSSNLTDDWAWRMPTYPELAQSVKSPIADIRNLGFPKGAGGMITAAEFLRQFTDGTEWAHLDIAGSSYVNSGERLYFGQGATGSSVRLLTHFIENNA